MNKLALGSVQFGKKYGVTNSSGQVHFEEVKKILNYAKLSKISTIDTASNYGNSEKVLGNLGINTFDIVTKTSSLKLGLDNVLKSFRKSLRNLNLDHVDGLLIHDVNDIKDKNFDELMIELERLKIEGTVKKIGFSIYNSEQINFLLENFDFDLIQVPFNVFDSRLINGGELKKLKNKGKEIHARSIFLQGLLLNFTELNPYFLKWKDDFDAYREKVKDSNLSLLEFALNFVVNVNEIDKVLVGVQNEKQLREIINSLGKGSGLSAFPINDINLLDPSLWKE